MFFVAKLRTNQVWQIRW